MAATAIGSRENISRPLSEMLAATSSEKGKRQSQTSISEMSNLLHLQHLSRAEAHQTSPQYLIACTILLVVIFFFSIIITVTTDSTAFF